MIPNVPQEHFGFGDPFMTVKIMTVCVTLWPCHLHSKRIMKTQIFHHAKIESSKNPLKETKILQDIITL
jgi:hypothetical protein